MTKYSVEVRWTLCTRLNQTYTVEAESEEEAMDIASTTWEYETVCDYNESCHDVDIFCEPVIEERSSDED